MRRLASLSRIVLLFVLLLSMTKSTEAQKGAAGPQAPTLNAVMPLGIQRGTSLDLVLTGSNLGEPVGVFTTIPGAKAAITTDKGNGPNRLLVKLEVPKNAPLGVQALRVATSRGLSNLRLFCVDDLPQVTADGKNRSPESAQAVPVASVVAGQVAAEARDYYKIKVSAGQAVSFEIIGRRLGSAFDPQISIIDPRNGRELAHNNDSPGQQTDPRLRHVFKEAGEYLVEVRDVLYRGGADYAYRLRIGDFPLATTPIPMAAKRGSKVSVSFAGPDVEGVPPVEVQVPSDPAVQAVLVTPQRPGGLPGWPVALLVSDLDERVEKEPNDEPAGATELPVPGAVTGLIAKKGDFDHYRLKLSKGKYIITADTLELGSPTDVYMVLKNEKGGDVARTVPTGPARLEVTAPADGVYLLSVEHLHQSWGGPSESYRISVAPDQPSFEVGLGKDGLDVPQGQAGVIGVQTVVRNNYKGPIELSVVGPPGIKGQAVIAGNIETKPGAPPAKGPPKMVANLVVQVDGKVGMNAYPLQVQCKAMIDGKPVVKYASVEPGLTQALAGLPFPPRHLLHTVALGVSEKPPFSLSARLEPPDVLKGGTANLVISVQRDEGFAEEVALAAADLPANVTLDAKGLKIAKGQNEAKATLKVAANVALGDYTVTISGRAKHNSREYAVTALPAPLEVSLPFALQVEPLKLSAGAKGKLKVTAVRKGGYQGPIALVVQNLPANVSAAKASIEQGKTEAEIELSAAANAPAGDKTDVTVQGTATAAGNQAGASPNFTISILKK